MILPVISDIPDTSREKPGKPWEAVRGCGRLWEAVGGRGRPWEAVGGRGSATRGRRGCECRELVGSHGSHDPLNLSESLGEAGVVSLIFRRGGVMSLNL